MTAGERFLAVRLPYRLTQGGTNYMGNLISISNDTSLKKLVALGNKLEEVLQEQFGIYGPTVYWQLLDEELMMQILIRIENSHILLGKVDFSSDVSDEKAKEYSLRLYSSLPEETFRYSKERLSEWSIIEKNVADYVFKEIEGNIWISGEIQEEA